MIHFLVLKSSSNFTYHINIYPYIHSHALCFWSGVFIIKRNHPLVNTREYLYKLESETNEKENGGSLEVWYARWHWRSWVLIFKSNYISILFHVKMGIFQQLQGALFWKILNEWPKIEFWEKCWGWDVGEYEIECGRIRLLPLRDSFFFFFFFLACSFR